MPFKNNRNSRDEKSGRSSSRTNNASSSKASPNKKDRTKPNAGKDKLFSSSADRPPVRERINRGSASEPESEGRRGHTGSDRDKKPFSGGIRTAKGRKEGEEGRVPDRKPRVDKPGAYPKSRVNTDKTGSADRDGRPASYGNERAKKSGERTYAQRLKFQTGEGRWDSEEKLRSNNRSKKLKEENGLIRLNRYIANAGICSRRKADELIAAGVVSVNGEAVTSLGHKVDPAKDLVKYNGETLRREKMVYVLLNKPKDYITTTDDPQERRTVMALVEKSSRERIYPVGRLDRNTTGLLLLTNDGDLADKLAHPRNNITKIYQAELNKNLTQGDLNKISFGLELEDGPIKPDAVSYVQGGSKREIGIQIHSGKNRIVRRIFEHLGYEVVKLDRVVYANLTKKDLTRGRWRYLEEKEVIQLKHLMQV